MKKAIFVSCTWNYSVYLNALLNSLEKRGLHDIDVHVLYYEPFSRQYLEDIVDRFSFNVITAEIARETSIIGEVSHGQFAKFARFEYMREAAMEYDVVGLLDADMMIVSPEFGNLFDLVHGTDKLIGCNEGFKWTVCHDQEKFTYILDDQPVFPEPTKLWKFHCSVPIIFDMKSWRSVFDYYIRLVTEGHEIKDGKQKNMGDMFSWNTAVQHEGRQGDLILFPMETMTQVHCTNTDPYRHVINSGGYWHTAAGDPVYTLHGRVDRPGWTDGHLTIVERRYPGDDKAKQLLTATMKMITDEWNGLNANGKVKIADYLGSESNTSSTSYGSSKTGVTVYG